MPLIANTGPVGAQWINAIAGNGPPPVAPPGMVQGTVNSNGAQDWVSRGGGGGGGGGGYGYGYGYGGNYRAAPPAPPPPVRANDGSIWPNQGMADQRNAEIEIAGGYQNYQSGLDNILTGLQPQQDATNQQIKTQFGNTQKQLSNELGNTTDKLDKQASDVQSSTKSGLLNLAQQFGRQLNSGTLMLGARGAGDSSATGQLGLSLSRAEAQNRGNVLGQENSNLSNVDLQKVQAQQSHDDMQRKLEDWQSNELQQALQSYNDIRSSIEREKAGAALEERTSLANLAREAATALSSKLGAVQSQFTQATSDLKNRLQATPIPQIPETLFAQQQNFQTTPITTPGLPGLQFGQGLPSTPSSTIAGGSAPLLQKQDQTATNF